MKPLFLPEDSQRRMKNILPTFFFILTLGSGGFFLMHAQSKQELWYHTGYPGNAAGSGLGMSALTGPTKMPAIFQALMQGRLLEGSSIHTDSPLVKGSSPFPGPIDLPSLRRVHTDRYLYALFTGEPLYLALSQGLPFWSESIAKGWLLNVGGLAAAAEAALTKRTITVNLGHGYHHALANRGMGFCTINGLVVVAKKLIQEQKASKVLILDLDHHEGNGTAEGILGDPNIANVSVYGAYMGGPPASENNQVYQIHHYAFPEGEERDLHYLAVIAEVVPPLIRRFQPDLVLYQAGMDPYDGAQISKEALALRDVYVFALLRSLDIPVTWVLAGGYAPLETLVELHLNTLRGANEVLERVNPGDSLVHQPSAPYPWHKKNKQVIFPDWKTILSKPLQYTQPATITPRKLEEFLTARDKFFREEELSYTQLFKAFEKVVPSP